MKNGQHQKILELLQTLKEAVGELRRQTSAEFLCELLADIQDFALQIGQFIESIEGEGTKTVELIGDFCDLIYQAYQEKSIEKYDKLLKARIFGIRNSVCSELKPKRLEVAFFPYKFSMADCLQSIWEAAMQDPDCDVTICPIPYYDRLPNGEFDKMHYEADAYPSGLPLVNWQEYKVEEERPDVIFVHSPYDDENRLTSVHPDFYCKRLRKFTRMLVYIPYFVVLSDIPEHLCVAAGSVYAQRTIVQSERVRDTYISQYRKQLGNRYGDPKEKFIALGSPKFDKVIGTKRESCILPEDWSRKISGKKTILLNTSLGAVLREETDAFLAKLRDTLSVFRGRSDVALWWRPHPLAESTFQKMPSIFANEYRSVVELYRMEDYGVYDDTPDMHRAIAWCDAYYGDGDSSVLALWMATGKPYLIQNIYRLFRDIEHPEEPAPDTAFSATARWAEHEESAEYPQIHLRNLLNALAAGKLPQLQRGKICEQYTMPEEGAGKAIYEYMKRQVMPT